MLNVPSGEYSVVTFNGVNISHLNMDGDFIVFIQKMSDEQMGYWGMVRCSQTSNYTRVFDVFKPNSEYCRLAVSSANNLILYGNGNFHVTIIKQ